jgi:large repetitive protein
MPSEEHSRRFQLALVLLGIVSAIAVTGASAADFDKDWGSGADCTEPPGGGQLLRCPTAQVGQKYEIEMQSEEGSGCTTLDGSNPYTWYEIVNSALPPGLSMTRAGVISGTPTSTGFFRFWVWNHDQTQAQGGPDWCKVEDLSEVEFSISVDPGLAINNETVKAGTIGQSYSETLTAKRVTSLNPVTGGDVQATWSLQSGALPTGLALSTQGLLTGTPTAEGRFHFVVRAATGGPAVTKEYTIGVRQPVVVKSPFGSAQRPTAEVGVRLTKSASATGGTGVYKWSLASGALPAGVSLDPSKGVVSGNPRAAGTFTFGLTATDEEGRVSTVSATLGVASKLAIRTVQLKPAKLGRSYQTRLATAGGVQPFKWTVVAGQLPAGLRFAKSLGTVTGTPREGGTFRLVVEARDALGVKARRAFVLRVTG